MKALIHTAPKMKPSKMKRSITYLSTPYLKAVPIALAALLTACENTDQDTGSTTSFSQTFSGVAVDGYIARSLVFIDYDNNGTRDPWEPSAFTDNDGYYSFNPITNTDYCAPGTAETEAIYCLVSTRPVTSAVIRVDGGYDVLTGEPFVGQMSRRQTVSESQPAVDSVISPLTSLFTDIQNDSDRQSLLSSLEINESDLEVDYLNTDGSGGVNTTLFNKAIKVHKVVTVLSDRVSDTYSEIGNVVGTPNDLSSLVYRNLATTIKNQNLPIDSVLSDTTALSDITLQTESQTREIYDSKNLDLPPLNATGNALPDYLRASEHAVNVVDIVDRVLNAEDTAIDSSNIIGRARAIESFVIKTLEETTTNDTTIENAANFFLSDTNAELIDSLISALSEEQADVSELVRNDFTGDDFDSSEEITAASQLPEGTQAFNLISGMQLRVADMDLGWGPDNLKDAEVEAYFYGNTLATSGEFDACVKYIEGAHIDGTLGDGNTRGELVSGYWSLLGAEKTNGSSFSLLLTITFLGSTYQAIMKPSGSSVIGGVESLNFRFDYGKEIRTWHSIDGLIQTESIPTSNEECEARLPSRIGLDD